MQRGRNMFVFATAAIWYQVTGRMGMNGRGSTE